MRELGLVLSGFDLSCNMVKPWAESGYLCYCVDIQHQKGLTPRNYGKGKIVKVFDANDREVNHDTNHQSNR